jgi:hypothetical protein
MGVMEICEIRVAVFPFPAGMSLPNSPWPGTIKLFTARESWLVTFPLGTGKSLTFCCSAMPHTFYSSIQGERHTVKNAVELLGAFRPDVEKIQYH